MKRIIASTAAIAALAFAGAAAAQSTSTVNVGGTVASQCGLGNQSGSASSDPQGYTSSVTISNITNANGGLNTDATATIGFGNVWCNGPSTITLTPSAFSTTTTTPDTSSFTSTLDLLVDSGGTGADEAKFTEWYMNNGTARTGAALTATRPTAFESGTGRGQRARVRLALPSGVTQANPSNGTTGDRPVAGVYSGTVTLTVTAG